MSKKDKGLYKRYEVTRVDGKEDEPGTTYFVLRFGEKHAKAALLAYANSVQDEQPQLARELRIACGEIL